jgi:hypothetical protein
VAPDFTYVSYPHPHVERGRQILAAHPELRALAAVPGHCLWVSALVARNWRSPCSSGIARGTWLPLA